MVKNYDSAGKWRGIFLIVKLKPASDKPDFIGFHNELVPPVSIRSAWE